MDNTGDIENSQPINGRATLLARCSITILILLLLAIISFSLILWLIFSPRLPEFNVESLSVSNANVSMEFTVKNPNRKINLWFSGFDVVLLHENCEILKGTVKVFSLRKRSEARMTVNWTNSGKMKNLGLDLSKKEVDFDVKMNGTACFKAGKWMNEKKSVQVLCKNLKTGDSAEADGCVSS
ncbi:Hypothetical predicted protein [Olea europaea subsp. europaea]|uniref:Late embryogenesis abundant protein LEA-2 subgroup domain-containing protein n=1 Tax=Olea europaea subsp. europaea TaxID=158383 RepID=A0A8S0V0X2_OLEEU|nr:Hypothetical predicted protein [Olea europaea subsp. europaea]